MSARTLFPFSNREALAFVVLGLAAGLSLPLSTTPAPLSPTDAPLADGRSCAALAVYSMGGPEGADDWALKASVSAVVLNTFKAETHSAACDDGTAAALRQDFSAVRWQASLDVVDAVATGDYWLPTDCFQATRILPPDSDEPATTSCVIDGYAFVRGDL